MPFEARHTALIYSRYFSFLLSNNFCVMRYSLSFGIAPLITYRQISRETNFHRQRDVCHLLVADGYIYLHESVLQ